MLAANAAAAVPSVTPLAQLRRGSVQGLDHGWDAASDSVLVVWTAADGLWMRRVFPSTRTLGQSRRLAAGTGMASPRLALLPPDGDAHSDLLVVVEQGGHLTARAFGGDGAPIGAPHRLSDGLGPGHSRASLLANDDGVVVAWQHRSAALWSTYVTRLDREALALMPRVQLPTAAVQLFLADLPPADGPGFLLAAQENADFVLRTFDLHGEELALTRRPNEWWIGLLPRDVGSLLQLSVVNVARGLQQVQANRMTDGGVGRASLARIGPRMSPVGARVYPFRAAVDSRGRLAITYGLYDERGAILAVDVVLFDALLLPRIGKRHTVASGPFGFVGNPVWTEDGEVVVVWLRRDAKRDRLQLGTVAFD